MKVLTITTLFPNSALPNHGIFVATRLRHLRMRYPEVEITVIAPVPWFPFKSARFGRYARFALVPAEEEIAGFRVLHPRYLVIPKIGMLLTPLTLALSLWLTTRKLTRDQPFDLIDGHYLYPDGVSVAWVARCLRLPCVLTARGTDLNLIPRHPVARRMISWAIRRASRVICVCDALREVAVQLGAGSKAVTLRNGVDLERFQPASDRPRLREKLGLKGFTLLSVGHLIERKGHHLVIEALAKIPEARLIIAGEGEEEKRLQELTRARSLEDRVTFLGAVPQAHLVQWYQAADLLVLASSREGWANVLLEAMACGTPVVATRIWGTPEVVASERVGLLTERSAPALTAAIRSMMEQPRDRREVRTYAEAFSWDETSDGLYRVFEEMRA